MAEACRTQHRLNSKGVKFRTPVCVEQAPPSRLDSDLHRPAPARMAIRMANTYGVQCPRGAEVTPTRMARD